MNIYFSLLYQLKLYGLSQPVFSLHYISKEHSELSWGNWVLKAAFSINSTSHARNSRILLQEGLLWEEWQVLGFMSPWTNVSRAVYLHKFLRMLFWVVFYCWINTYVLPVTHSWFRDWTVGQLEKYSGPLIHPPVSSTLVNLLIL